jgi:hypothetical protein
MPQLAIRTDDDHELWVDRDIIHIPRLGDNIHLPYDSYKIYRVIEVNWLYGESNSYSIMVIVKTL